ncbi:PIN domain-containing protein [Dictyoglomus thermophilum]|uniref:Type II toxin-antitoxin system VapC family toxin n=1 Tax=Dictyoglomus thermophilum (strain ATCC 35947 / DSM 3960 / H-6-12) TaxID=309799 RepID=B5YCS0_DICT6|nr:hypothetical protein [Dictyoglomus thermophilum]ACI18273.1 hypothetical protein DICTH_0446 [Dictyoglomus thermophilum H-6-12]
MKFLDNLLLQYFTKDDRVLTSPLVIFETIFMLQSYYKLPRKEIRDLLIPILNLRGLKLDYKDIFE